MTSVVCAYRYKFWAERPCASLITSNRSLRHNLSRPFHTWAADYPIMLIDLPNRNFCLVQQRNVFCVPDLAAGASQRGEPLRVKCVAIIEWNWAVSFVALIDIVGFRTSVHLTDAQKRQEIHLPLCRFRTKGKSKALSRTAPMVRSSKLRSPFSSW